MSSCNHAYLGCFKLHPCALHDNIALYPPRYTDVKKGLSVGCMKSHPGLRNLYLIRKEGVFPKEILQPIGGISGYVLLARLYHPVGGGREQAWRTDRERAEAD